MDKDLSKSLTQIYSKEILYFDEPFLLSSIRKRMTGTNSSSSGEYMALILQDRNERQIFMDSLLNNYSEFFRNSLTYSVLEHIILPGIVLKKTRASKKMIRIWSAACASGQEAYSLAILMEELKPSMNEHLQYMIFASDHNESSVEQAKQGNYYPAALNNVPLKHLNRWFSGNCNTFTINPDLKKNISFSVFDLLDERSASPPAGIYGDFDLIVCSNLLFYYKEDIRKIIIDKLSNCLAESCYLVTGEAEREMLMSNDFLEVFPQSGIFQKM